MAEPEQASVVDTMGEILQAAEFGATLREMRLAYGRSLVDAAADLRIRQVYLVAIEDGRFDDLPGPTYALGFVRAYATYLGLDVAEVVKRYRAATGDVANSTHAALVQPSPVAEGGLPTGSVLLVAAVLALLAYGGWYYLSIDGRDAGNMIAGLPQRIAALVGMRGEPPPPARKTPAPVPQSAVSAQRAAEPASQPASPDPAAPSQAAPDSRTDAAMQAVTDDTAASPPEPEAAATEPEAATGTTSLGAREGGAQGDAAETAATEPSPLVVASETPLEVAVTAAPEPQAVTATEAPAASEPQAVTATEAPATPEPQAVTVTEAPAAPEPPAVTVTEAPATAPAAAGAAAPTATAAGSASPIVIAAAPAIPAARPSRTAPLLPLRVVLRATARSWVEVNEGPDKAVFARLMYPGDIFEVPPRPGFTMSTGNAGGVQIFIGGELLPPLGPLGAVRRDVVLEAETLLRNAGAAR